MDMEKFKGTLLRFAGHLREAGEEKAAEAVDTIAKYVSRFPIDTGQETVPDIGDSGQQEATG